MAALKGLPAANADRGLLDFHSTVVHVSTSQIRICQAFDMQTHFTRVPQPVSPSVGTICATYAFYSRGRHDLKEGRHMP